MTPTKIEWSDEVWNPTTGCDRVSPGCDNCYAMTLAKRLKGMGSAKYQRDGNPATSGSGFGLTVHPDALDAPLHWRKPRRVFVNSMSDLFHDKVPDEFIARVFAVMAATPQHTYQVLTKRHGRMRSLLSSTEFEWSVFGYQKPGERMHVGPASGRPLSNVWLGVSVEDQKRADLRIPALLDTPAAVRFLSCEPLLGPVDLSRWLQYECPTCHRRAAWTDGQSVAAGDSLDEYWCQTCGAESPLKGCDYYGPNWVIVGGESGPGARPMHPDWARTLRDQCTDAGAAFFMKQWGAWAPVNDQSWRDRRESDWHVRHDGYKWPLVEPHGAEDGTQVLIRRVGKHAAGRELDGRTWDEYPAVSA